MKISTKGVNGLKIILIRLIVSFQVKKLHNHKIDLTMYMMIKWSLPLVNVIYFKKIKNEIINRFTVQIINLVIIALLS